MYRKRKKHVANYVKVDMLVLEV